jgi:hypothetical protein
MTTDNTTYRDETYTGEAAHRTEHGIAWFMAAAATVFAILGALEAFDVASFGTSFLEEVGAGVTTTTGSDADFFRDGMLWFMPAIATGLLALTFHRTEHHVSYGNRHEDVGDDVRRDERGAWGFEHFGAYAAAVASIAFLVMGLLVGFDVFDSGYTWYDGMTWHLLSVVSSIIAATLHPVGHHSAAYDESYVRSVVGDRTVGISEGTSGVTRRTEIERR